MASAGDTKWEWTSGGQPNTPGWAPSATLLRDGRVLLTGGSSRFSGYKSTELYVPATGAWSDGGSLHTARVNHTATLLDDGRVLVAGGSESDTSGWLSSCELITVGARQ